MLAAALRVAKESADVPSPTLEQARTVAHVVKRAKQHADLEWVIQSSISNQQHEALFAHRCSFCECQAGGKSGREPGTDALEEGQTASWTPAAWKSEAGGSFNVCMGNASVGRWSWTCWVVGMPHEMIDGVVNLGKRHEALHRFRL